VADQCTATAKFTFEYDWERKIVCDAPPGAYTMAAIAYNGAILEFTPANGAV
jgi:hypothetical protein